MKMKGVKINVTTHKWIAAMSSIKKTGSRGLETALIDLPGEDLLESRQHAACI